MDYYGNIVKILEQAGGYHPAASGRDNRKGEREYYVFTYDWRQDNVITAGRLADLVERIKEDHGDPNLQVDLIAQRALL